MNIIVACKVVPDDQDIQVMPDGALDYSKAKPIISAYDMNAIEAAAQLAAASEGSRVVAISAGGASIDDSKLKKNIMARGVDELFMAADDALGNLDSRATASVLADMVEQAGSFDLLICGDGSADEYAQQVDVQLAARLGLPVVTAASKIMVDGSVARICRSLEDAVEVVEIELPAVVSVVPDAALPRIPGMRDILAAGKKPMNVVGCPADVSDVCVETITCAAPEQAQRKNVIMDASEEGATEKFAQAIKAAL